MRIYDKIYLACTGFVMGFATCTIIVSIMSMMGIK